MTTPEVNQEERFFELRDQILANLNSNFQARMADPSHPYSGPEIVTVAGSRADWKDGRGLMLDRDGSWSINFDMNGFTIKDTSVTSLLREYASMMDPECPFMQNREPPPSPDEINQYLQSKRPELLGGLIMGMERALLPFNEPVST